MKKHKGKIQMGIVIGIFSSILITCLVSVFSQLYTENKEKEEFRQLAEIVTEETTDATLEEIVRKPNLAGDIKLSPATVRRAIKDLKKVGLIETKQRYREHGGKSSLLYKMFNRQK